MSKKNHAQRDTKNEQTERLQGAEKFQEHLCGIVKISAIGLTAF
jgi:hypothetical protein